MNIHEKFRALFVPKASEENSFLETEASLGLITFLSHKPEQDRVLGASNPEQALRCSCDGKNSALQLEAPRNRQREKNRRLFPVEIAIEIAGQLSFSEARAFEAGMYGINSCPELHREFSRKLFSLTGDAFVGKEGNVGSVLSSELTASVALRIPSENRHAVRELLLSTCPNEPLLKFFLKEADLVKNYDKFVSEFGVFLHYEGKCATEKLPELFKDLEKACGEYLKDATSAFGSWYFYPDPVLRPKIHQILVIHEANKIFARIEAAKFIDPKEKSMWLRRNVLVREHKSILEDLVMLYKYLYPPVRHRPFFEL